MNLSSHSIPRVPAALSVRLEDEVSRRVLVVTRDDRRWRVHLLMKSKVVASVACDLNDCYIQHDKRHCVLWVSNVVFRLTRTEADELRAKLSIAVVH